MAGVNLLSLKEDWRLFINDPLNQIVVMNMCSPNADAAVAYAAEGDHRSFMNETLYEVGARVRFSSRNEVGAILEAAAWERSPEMTGRSLVTKT